MTKELLNNKIVNLFIIKPIIFVDYTYSIL